ncbi:MULTISPECIES: lipid-binding SYLF domain-containing protein [Azospirillaceae]|uniref:lipid-binding SYLF domain-containing protein n=1 Tax=Azospirillaceae TaxID=2829815 RepID=UPI000B72FF04|nr:MULTISPECIES: lipid-binding SYLF domain-containing protein [Azospirillaceae]MDG5494782.1 lipid-binding SYLF domain-containing protein [Niveispirillum sp. BGYR6]SNS23986.1 Lipid-binding SYLF domain-containing protein [Azospirillum sp. RU38E]SNS42248.1 Lipid-binding SYLF domain-containing protein [Azospirillum sp. RU37A]
MKRFAMALAGLVLAISALVRPAYALTEPELMVERARVTALTLLTDPEYSDLKNLVGRARAVLILPNVIQAGFFIGGGGGTGVMVARGDDGAWSGPAFYTLAEASFGLQFGGQASEMIVVIMTQKGLDAVIDRKVKLGADANVAIGELGTGVGASYGVGLSSDIYVYSKTSGLFGGMALEGSVIAPRSEFNDKFYGQPTDPRAILVDRHFYRPEAQALASALTPAQ